MTEARWDLTQLVDSTDPQKIIKELDHMVETSTRLAERYRGRIADLDAKGVLELLETLDALALRYEGTLTYCQLLYSADTTDVTAKQLNDVVMKTSTKTRQHLAFVDIDLAKLLQRSPSLVDDPSLSEFKHSLERQLRKAPHLLSESEERLIMTKDQNGVHAWSQLQREWLSTRTFSLTIDGEERTLTYGQIIGLYSNPDRALRMAANKEVYDRLGQDEMIWSSAIRAICDDHVHSSSWRGFDSPLGQSILSNDVEREHIDALMGTIVKNTGVYRHYLRTKAKMMGLEKLANWDIVAPLPDAMDKEYSWEEARKIVVSAYTGFDKQVGHWVEEMYERRHLDGEVRKGKVSGAFCQDWYNGKSAYVLQSFNGRLDDLYTQAHEQGHAVHAYLCSRAQRPSNCAVSMCIAECGSIFGELLLTDKLLSEAKDDKERQAVLCQVLDGFGMAAFQVSARYFFEWSMYDTIAKGGFLDGEMVASLWTKARDDIYGDAVEWLPEMRWEWTMKMHYYIAGLRFYNYPYVFAQLFVFALYRLYKEQGTAFAPRVKALLAAGSSRSAADLAKEFGFDITKEEFWQKGIAQAEEFISQLERTL
jgi:oligoendopeptidase F